MTLRQELQAEILSFLKETRMPKTTLGVLAVKSPSFVDRFFDGADIKISSVDRVRRTMKRELRKHEVAE